MNIDSIKPYEKNAKKHPAKQIQQVANSIKEFGFNQPIVVDKQGVIIVGHGRYEASKLLGLKDVPVVEVDLTEEQAKAYRLADNKLNESEWDMKLAVDELKELSEEMQKLTGFDLDLLIEPDEKDDVIPEDAPPVAKLGDLWVLGRHRLLCGDSTKFEDVERLMDGKKANATFTDPPYLMDFTGNVHADGSKSLNAKHGKLLNDKLTDEQKKEFLDGFLTNIRMFTIGAYYICWYRLGLHHLFNGIQRAGLDYRALVIWDKGNHTLSNSDYQSKFEPIVYGWVDKHEFYGGRNCFDLWKVDRTKANTLHPTMKPVELVVKALTDSTQQNSIVMDLFLGSGSTIIAAEKTKRICYGMELDPKYCDVIIKRWEDYTGLKATKI